MCASYGQFFSLTLTLIFYFYIILAVKKKPKMVTNDHFIQSVEAKTYNEAASNHHKQLETYKKCCKFQFVGTPYVFFSNLIPLPPVRAAASFPVGFIEMSKKWVIANAKHCNSITTRKKLARYRAEDRVLWTKSQVQMWELSSKLQSAQPATKLSTSNDK